MKKTMILATVLMLVAVCSFAVTDNDSSIPKMSVQGTGKIEVTADQFQLNIGVKTVDKTADVALKINSAKMNKIEDVLRELKIPEKNYQTNGFSIKPVFSQRPRNAGTDWQRKIIGYEVDNKYKIKSTDLKIISPLITKSTEAGANDVSSVEFSLSNPYKYRAEAIQCAVKNAENDAMALLEATDEKIEKILNVSINNFYMPTLRVANSSFAMESGDASQIIPVNPGTITLEVKVSIIYQISKRNHQTVPKQKQINIRLWLTPRIISSVIHNSYHGQ